MRKAADNECCESEEISPMEMLNSCESVDEQFLVGDDWEASIERLSSNTSHGNESLSEIIDSFRLSKNIQTGNYTHAQVLPSRIDHANAMDDHFRGKKRNKFEKCGGSQANHDHTSNQNEEGEKPKEVSTENTNSSKERDEKKQRIEVGSSSQDNSNAPNQDYIHIRAKRGQATNSHSLAERVRREKISERMKLLQDIVPGCNKVTGKAAMLDEIINYVQSLQKQVEFLSMKLATVNPEINVDIEEIVAKEHPHSRYENFMYLGHFQQMLIPDFHLQPRTEIPNPYINMEFHRTATNYQLPDFCQIPNAWDSGSHGP